MKALVCDEYGHYRDLRFCDVEQPQLKPGCVRIAVHYATVGFGQTLVIAGKYQRKPPLPFVPGTEVAGVVLEVAQDVRGFAPGNRVTAALDWGRYAEQAIATASTTWHVPDEVPLATAASSRSPTVRRTRRCIGAHGCVQGSRCWFMERRVGSDCLPWNWAVWQGPT